MKITLKQAIGAVVLVSAIPLPVWLFWQKSYTPKQGIDAWINSFHPYVAGLIGELMILSFVGIVCIGVSLMTKKEK